MANTLLEKLENDLTKEISKVIIEERNIMLLEQYGIKDILYFDDRKLFESLKGDEDYEEFKFIMGRLRYIIPSLMKKLISIGAKKSVEFVCKYAKKLYEKQKQSAALRYVFYGLVYIAMTAGIYTCHKYNEKPVIPDTKIEYSDSTQTMTVYEEDEPSVVFVMDENKQPEIVRPSEVPQPKNNVKNTVDMHDLSAVEPETEEKKSSKLSVKS